MLIRFGYIIAFSVCLLMTIRFLSQPMPSQSKPSLYLISIGVSKYELYPQKNLTYAAKDAEDIVKRFTADNQFGNIKSFLVRDTAVTRDFILLLKKELLKTTEDDCIIITYSGHGLITDQLTFYFTTFKTNLKNLASTSISFEELENLVDSVPARKKLMLIDACYSGQADKDKTAYLPPRGKSGDSVVYRGSKTLTPVRNKNSGINLFEMMRNTFVDLTRKTGTTILTSSSSVDVSYEKDELKNGLFTHVILNALTEKSPADYNYDGTVMLSELLKYVIHTVPSLSRGIQIPTVREDNSNYDFPIWRK